MEVRGHLSWAPKTGERSALYVANHLKKVSARHVRIRFALKPWLMPPEKRHKHDPSRVEGRLGGHSQAMPLAGDGPQLMNFPFIGIEEVVPVGE